MRLAKMIAVALLALSLVGAGASWAREAGIPRTNSSTAC